MSRFLQQEATTHSKKQILKLIFDDKRFNEVMHGIESDYNWMCIDHNTIIFTILCIQ